MELAQRDRHMDRVFPLFFIVVTESSSLIRGPRTCLFNLTGLVRRCAGGGKSRASHQAMNRAGNSLAPDFRSLDDIALVASKQNPGWYSMTIAVPESEDLP